MIDYYIWDKETTLTTFGGVELTKEYIFQNFTFTSNPEEVVLIDEQNETADPTSPMVVKAIESMNVLCEVYGIDKASKTTQEIVDLINIEANKPPPPAPPTVEEEVEDMNELINTMLGGENYYV